MVRTHKHYGLDVKNWCVGTWCLACCNAVCMYYVIELCHFKLGSIWKIFFFWVAYGDLGDSCGLSCCMQYGHAGGIHLLVREALEPWQLPCIPRTLYWLILCYSNCNRWNSLIPLCVLARLVYTFNLKKNSIVDGIKFFVPFKSDSTWFFFFPEHYFLVQTFSDNVNEHSIDCGWTCTDLPVMHAQIVDGN